MTVKDRIKEFCKAENMTISAFEFIINCDRIASKKLDL